MTLKIARCAFYLLCTPPHFPFSAHSALTPPPFRQHWNVCMRNLLRNFMTRKKKASREKEKEGKRNFWYLLFCCLFLLFHFLIIGLRRTKVPNVGARGRARCSPTLARARAKSPQRREFPSFFAARHTQRARRNVMIINYGVRVLERIAFESREIFSIYITYQAGDHEASNPSFSWLSPPFGSSWVMSPPLWRKRRSHQLGNVSEEFPGGDQCNQSECLGGKGSRWRTRPQGGKQKKKRKACGEKASDRWEGAKRSGLAMMSREPEPDWMWLHDDCQHRFALTCKSSGKCFPDLIKRPVNSGHASQVSNYSDLKTADQVKRSLEKLQKEFSPGHHSMHKCGGAERSMCKRAAAVEQCAPW